MRQLRQWPETQYERPFLQIPIPYLEPYVEPLEENPAKNLDVQKERRVIIIDLDTGEENDV